MKGFEFSGFNGASFRAPIDGLFSNRQLAVTTDVPTKGMEQQVQPDVDPRITEAIIGNQPTPPKRERIIGTYAKWISDTSISSVDTNPEVVNIFRAVVSEDNPLSIDQISELSGTTAGRVEELVSGMPFVSIDIVDGETQIDMPEVQIYIAEWKGKAIQHLPAGIEPQIVDELLTPSPTNEIKIFEADFKTQE